MNQRGLFNLKLLIFSLLFIPIVYAQTGTTPICPEGCTCDEEGNVITCQDLYCQENTPSLYISPLTQEGNAGNTLIYELIIENKDIYCQHRWFSLVHHMPIVPPHGWVLEDCRQNLELCLWDTITCFDGETIHYPDGWCSGIFKLEAQEKATLKLNLTSKDDWPDGGYLHYIQLFWSVVGEEHDIYFNWSLKKNFTYKIISTTTTPICPDGCVCDEEIITCPTEKTCPKGCICEDDVMSCSVEETITTPICPVSCVCKGGTIMCPTEQKSIETKIISGTTTTGGVETTKISIGNTSSGAITIEKGTVKAITSEKVSVIESKLYMETSVGNKEIKILPKDASNKATEMTLISKIEIKEELQKPIYFITGTKQARIFFIFPVTLEIETKVSGETGDVLSVNKPWWSFLAW